MELPLNKKQHCFVLLDYQLAENLILAFGFNERIKKNKINIISEFAVIIGTFMFI